MKANILVTGGAGYIGAVLTKHLLDLGHDVILVDRFNFGANGLLSLLSRPNLKIVKADVRDFPKFEAEMKRADYIIPLAALVGAPLCDLYPHEATSVNLENIISLINKRSGSQKILYPTTNSGYGAKSGEIHCDENTPLEPISLYGETKVKAEAALLESGNAITFRFATAFGLSPSMRFDLLVNDFVYQAIKNKTLVLYEKDFKRNFVHVHDIARCFAFAIENFEKMKDRPYNCGHSDFNLSKIELAHKIKQFIPELYIHCSDYHSDIDRRNYIVSNEQIEKMGFRAKIGLDEGIQEIMKSACLLDHFPKRSY